MSYLDFIKDIKGIDINLKNKVKSTFDLKNKPLNSLGNLEEFMSQISAIKGKEDFVINKKKHFVFAADNGVVDENISPCKKELTQFVSETMLEGQAAVGILSKTFGVELFVVDVGIDGEINTLSKNFINLKTNKGTKNIKIEAAMTHHEVDYIFENIFSLVKEHQDMDIASCGEMGIGNTTSSAAIIHKILGNSLDEVVGVGSGANEEMLFRKKEVIRLACNRFESDKPFEILMQLGGFDIAAMSAFYLACAYYGIPVILDGFISLAAALLAYKINPLVLDYLIPSHETKELGARIVNSHLGFTPSLNLKLALGEGTGAIFMYPIIDSSLVLYRGMLSKKDFEERYGL